MSRQKPYPIPDMTAYNLRRRSEAMRLIASTMEDPSTRETLLRKADDFERQAREAQQERPHV